MTAMEPARGAPLVVSQGDPDGVGPELLLHAASRGALRPCDRVFADVEVVAHRTGALTAAGVDWARRGLAALEPLLAPDADWRRPRDAPHARGQVAALEAAVDAVLGGEERPALVTAPIDKAACQGEGFAYPGHTEYLAARAGVDDFAMAMVGPRLRVVLATIHEPLRRVPDLLDAVRIERAGRLLAEALGGPFEIARPRVAVLGLNPHAGEQGVLGTEERDVIAPAVVRLQAWGASRDVTFSGPLPADTAIPRAYEGHFDGVVAMYHDQGLGPFKLVHFHDGVNCTLGLGFVRTSPDHGTARDIAGTGVVDPRSFLAAVTLARRLGAGARGA